MAVLSTPAKRQKSHLTVWAQRTGAVCLQACWGEDWAGRRSGAGSCLHVQLSRARLVDARRAQHVEVIRLAGSLPPNRRIKSGAVGRDVHASAVAWMGIDELATVAGPSKMPSLMRSAASLLQQTLPGARASQGDMMTELIDDEALNAEAYATRSSRRPWRRSAPT